MTKKQAINNSIAHWKRMIKWARKQPVNRKPDIINMFKAIGEIWHDDDCALCQKYYHEFKGCDDCPLNKAFGECSSSKNNNLWFTVIKSKSWGIWIVNAEAFLKQLESLL